jgi:adenine phosphoribosyltransferase
MTPPRATAAEIQAAIRNVPDFPKPGIQFKDITPVLADPRLFGGAVDWLAGGWRPGQVDVVVGVEARGFIFAAAVATQLETGFVPVRKPGKLPWHTLTESYDLEYGSNTLALHGDAVGAGTRALVVDDLLATGGTALAAATLLRRLGAEVIEMAFLIELGFLHGRDRLGGYRTRALIAY